MLTDEELKQIENEIDYHERDSTCLSVMSCCSAADHAKTLLDEVKRLRSRDTWLSPWISVEERLPEPEHKGKSLSADVLVLSLDNGVSLGYYSITSGWYDYQDGDGISRSSITEITHWMPLPEPPK